jgi:hypothetical protein
MIKELGDNLAAIAQQVGISVQQLNNMVSKGQEVEFLLKQEKEKRFCNE